MILATGQSVDFMIHGLIEFELFGQQLWITTTHVSMLIVMTLIIAFALVVRVKLKSPDETPGLLQSGVEVAIEMLENMVSGVMGADASGFVNYIGSIFIFILISNISGLFGLRPPTADFGVTLPLGLFTFFIIHYQNIKCNKIKAFTGLFEPLPFLFPINLIGEVATPFSLGLRLFGNVLSGTVIMALFYGLVPVLLKFGVVPAVLHAYFDLFSGCIQTYVFCMLTMTYIKDKM
ncbi:MAG: F0F1 ATP synthase subunit A [Lachnospiraceae bacterium]|nr:F0F1 ATP synthase subunit A [Lachnospiraceae bacterium]MBR5584032.1 F0F1 ATP synthase subunit A [Lachnospiraceae bacterium]